MFERAELRFGHRAVAWLVSVAACRAPAPPNDGGLDARRAGTNVFDAGIDRATTLDVADESIEARSPEDVRSRTTEVDAFDATATHPVARGLGTIGRGSGNNWIGYVDGPGRGTWHPRPEPRVTFGTPTVRGSIPVPYMRRFAAEHVARFRYCYEQVLDIDPAAAGSITVRFIVVQQGVVIGATIGATSFTTHDLDACLTTSIRQWSFPPLPEPGITRVDLPIHFHRP